MSDILVPNGVSVEMVYLWLGQRVENVYHMTRGSPATLAQLTSLWTVMKDWENVTAKVQRGSGASLVLISIKALDSLSAPVYEAAVSPVISGSVAAASAPSVLTLAVKHGSGLGGRSYRGRSYWIGLTTTQLSGDAVSTTLANNIAAVYNTLRTVLATAGWTFSVASKYSGVQIVNGYRRAIPRSSGILTPIIQSTCEVNLDTNRHRKIPQAI